MNPVKVATTKISLISVEIKFSDIDVNNAEVMIDPEMYLIFNVVIFFMFYPFLYQNSDPESPSNYLEFNFRLFLASQL